MNLLADTPRLELFRLAGIPVRVDITFALVPLFLFGILQQAPLAIAGSGLRSHHCRRFSLRVAA